MTVPIKWSQIWGLVLLNRPISQIPQYISQISHIILEQKCLHMGTLLLQNCSLWDIRLVHCGICENSSINSLSPVDFLLLSFKISFICEGQICRVRINDIQLCNWLSLRCLVPWINHLPPVCWSTFGILVWNDSGYVNLTQWWYFFIIFEYILHISTPHIMIFCFPLPYFPLSTNALFFA